MNLVYEEWTLINRFRTGMGRCSDAVTECVNGDLQSGRDAHTTEHVNKPFTLSAVG